MRPDSNWDDIERTLLISRVPDSNDVQFLAVTKKLGVLLAAHLSRKGAQIRDAEELALESLEKVILQIDKYREIGSGSFAAWCCRIAENHWKNWVRGRAKEYTLDADTWRNVASTLPENDEASGDHDYVWAAFAQLSSREQQLIKLRVIDCLEFADIARAIHRTPGAARQAYHRAKENLALLLLHATPEGKSLGEPTATPSRANDVPDQLPSGKGAGRSHPSSPG